LTPVFLLCLLLGQCVYGVLPPPGDNLVDEFDEEDDNDDDDDFDNVRNKAKSGNEEDDDDDDDGFEDGLIDDDDDGGVEAPVVTKKPITCPVKGNPSNPCDGQTCLVNDVDECKQVMKQNGCGVATYSQQGDQLQCKMLLQRSSSLPADSQIHLKANVNEILYFKMYSGVGASPTPADAFISSGFSNEIRFPRTKSTSFSTGIYYKSPLWNIRNQLGATSVSVAMHGNMGGGGQDACSLTFANTNGGNGEWFNKNNMIHSFPSNVDHLKRLGYSFFTLSGWRAGGINRQFYAMQHGGCPGDVGPMTVIAQQDPCSWGNSGQALPRFICSATDHSQANNEPNINHRGRWMRELEVTGKLSKPMNILYAGPSDN
jgi:hypothetical protein